MVDAELRGDATDQVSRAEGCQMVGVAEQQLSVDIVEVVMGLACESAVRIHEAVAEQGDKAVVLDREAGGQPLISLTSRLQDAIAND